MSLHYDYELTGHDRHTKEHSLDCQAQVQVQIVLRTNILILMTLFSKVFIEKISMKFKIHLQIYLSLP